MGICEVPYHKTLKISRNFIRYFTYTLLYFSINFWIMKTKEKIRDYFLKFMRLIIPKTELEKRLDEIDELKNNPDNYGNVAMMYYKLQNIHAMLIGRNGDDNWNFFLVDFYGKQYKMYREMYIEHKVKN